MDAGFIRVQWTCPNCGTKYELDVESPSAPGSIGMGALTCHDFTCKRDGTHYIDGITNFALPGRVSEYRILTTADK